jgi:hypothetical protein
MIPGLLNNDWFKSTAALVIGWFLSAINPYLSERRERRKAIARALADLLEIRHRLVVIDSAVNELSKIVSIPTEVEMQIRLVFQNLSAKWHQVGQQYSESVTLVKSIDPLLGFKLQSKDELQPMLSDMFAVVAETKDMKAVTIWKSINVVILREAESDLDELIKKLALKRSLWARWRVNKILGQRRTLPKGGDAIIEILRTEIAKENTPEQGKAAVAGDAK